MKPACAVGVRENPAWQRTATAQLEARAAGVHLTPRQLEVLSLLCQGLPNKLICRQLNIASGTVKVHIGVILRELGVSSRLQAVVAAQRGGFLRSPVATGTIGI